MNQFVTFLWERKFKVAFYLFLLYFTYLIILITLQYVPVDFDVAFLRIKQDVIGKIHYQIAFFTHVYSSIFVLLIGLVQFSNTLRNRFTKVHRLLGKSYLVLITALAAPSGLIIGYYANGGIIAQIGFMLLSLLWYYFTYKAIAAAVQRKFDKHRVFMMRSFALTLSAISLRLLKWVIVSIWELPPMDTTQIIAWGGWMLNLILLEIYFAFQKRQTA